MSKKILILVMTGIVFLMNSHINTLANETEEETNDSPSVQPIVTTSPVTVEVKSDLSDLELNINVSNLTQKTMSLDVDLNDLNLEDIGNYDGKIILLNEEKVIETIDFIINVTDTTPPDVVLEQQVLRLEVFSGPHDFLEYVTVSDNYNSNKDIDIEYNEPNLNELGTYALTFEASDQSGNKGNVTMTVHIQDTTNPIITEEKPLTIQALTSLEDVNWFHYIKITDNYDQELTPEIDTSEINLDVLGAYPVSFTVTDSSGNSTLLETTVHVTDLINPVIEGLSDVKIDEGDEFNPLNGITATDNYDGDLTSKIEILSEYDVNKAGNYDIELEVTDSSGNRTRVSYELNVEGKVLTPNVIRYGLVAVLVIAALIVVNRRKRHLRDKKN